MQNLKTQTAIYIVQGLNSIVIIPFEDFEGSPGGELETTLWVEKDAVTALYNAAELSKIAIDLTKPSTWLYKVAFEFGVAIGNAVCSNAAELQWIRKAALEDLAFRTIESRKDDLHLIK